LGFERDARWMIPADDIADFREPGFGGSELRLESLDGRALQYVGRGFTARVALPRLCLDALGLRQRQLGNEGAVAGVLLVEPLVADDDSLGLLVFGKPRLRLFEVRTQGLRLLVEERGRL